MRMAPATAAWRKPMSAIRNLRVMGARKKPVDDVMVAFIETPFENITDLDYCSGREILHSKS